MSYIGAKPASGRSGIWLPEAVRRRRAAGRWDPLVATGGTVTDITVGGVAYRVHTFLSSGTFEALGSGQVEYLVIAGGGSGGGGWQAGGGGAGGYRCSVAGEQSGGGAAAESPLLLTPGSYTVTVGAGGTGVSSSANAGQNSVFHTITAIGGGRGAFYSGSAYQAATAGGSGGGGEYAGAPQIGANGTAGQGYRGGDGMTPSPYNAGGGGGAGGAGANGANMASGTGGTGGAGVTSSITGTPIARAGGGGGAGSTTGGAASAGGGAGGRDNASAGTSGAANTGGGGGGGRGNAALGGSGGSGIVIVRYVLD